jgi:diguanylate cyclase (GGDEF)-like protein
MVTSTRRGRVRQRVVNLPVGRKLFLGFGALTCVLALVISCLFFTVARLGAANNEIVKVAASRAQSADELRVAAAELHAAQQGYVFNWPATRTQFDEAAGTFEDALQALRESGGGAVAQALIHKVATGYDTFRQTDQLILQALQAGDGTLARNLTNGAESLAFGFMAEDATKLSDVAESGRINAIDDFRDTSANARILGVALGIIALMVMLLASWLITRLIRDPLHRVQLAAERAAEGDLQAEADVIGEDETGRLARAFNSMLAKLRLREETLIAEHQRQETSSKVLRAFEMAEDESMALEVVALTMGDLLPGRSSELLLADNSKSNLEQAVVAGTSPDGPGCPVASPFSCVAVRSGAPVTFASSTAVDACPHLRNRGVAPCSAVCVPVTFMGHAIGVIHAVGDEHDVADAGEIEALTMLSSQAGARIGMLRTMVRTQIQATSDSLTGLMNRRLFQTRIRSLRRADTSFVLVMADIDHFKRVNDTHGHETGDRALKTFCDVARSYLRQSDLMARWGGEEFAFAFFELSAEQALEVIDRIRLGLAARLSTSDLPSFTVSYGIVDTDRCESLEVAVRLADDALYEAKAQGRDCSIIAATGDIGARLAGMPEVNNRLTEQLSARSVGVLASLARDDDPQDL